MTIKLGNLRPLQEAKLNIQLIFKLDIVFGQYKFFLPVDFYPNYTKFGGAKNFKYGFDFILRVKSSKPVHKISIPPNSIALQMSWGAGTLVKCKKPS